MRFLLGREEVRECVWEVRLTEQGTIEGDWVDVSERSNFELRIDPELRGIIRPLTKEERTSLEQSLLREGIRDPIVLWGSTIVDGHNRYEIASGNNEDGIVLEFDTAQIEFESHADAKLWVARNQLSRRNLTDADRFELAEHIYAVEKELAEQRMLAGKKPGGVEDPEPNLAQGRESPDDGKSATRAAKAVGLGRESFRKLRKVRGSGRRELWEAIRAGELSVDRAYQIVRITEELPGELGEEVASLDPDEFTFVHDPKQLKRLGSVGEDEGMILLELIVSDDKEDIRTVFAAEKYLKNKRGALPKKEEGAGKKWSSAMHDIQMRLNSIRDMGGIEAMTASWTPEDKGVLSGRLSAMSQTLDEFSQALKGGEK